MRISKIVIRNFRSIRELELEVPQICALVGPNNAGKTNILQAINRVLGKDWVSVTSFSEDDVYGRDPANDFEISVSFDPPIPYAKLKNTDSVNIQTVCFSYTRYKATAQKGQRRLDQSCLDSKGKQPMVVGKQPKKGEAHQYEPVVGIPGDVREAIPLIYIGTHRALKDQLPGARYSLLRQLLEDIDRDFRDPKHEVSVVRADGTTASLSREARFRELMGEAMNMLRTTEFDRLETAIKSNALKQLGLDAIADADKLDFFFSPFDSMDFYRSLDLLVQEGTLRISATEMGEGVQNALVLSILQAFEQRRKKGAILLIEEPEMFLHPQKQRSLYRTLGEIGKTNQVIYTTHSPHFVTVPDYQDVVLVRRPSDGTRTRRSDLPPDAKRREKLIKELDSARNEMFFATRVLFVEGPTEKLALPEYATRLGLDLDLDGATIVEVGGKRNLPAFAEIAKSFEIPVGVLFDSDSSDFKDAPDEEKEFNAALKALEQPGGLVRVWELSRNFEDYLKRAWGENRYQQECARYPKTGKPTRARLFAADATLSIPEPLPEVLYWLCGRAMPIEASTPPT
jgi:predicted ATPase